MHDNKKPFKCDLCNYSIFQHANLRRHIECVHENLKQHQCNICQKKFGLKCTLKMHIQSVHENKKPFKCDVCDYSAFQHVGLKKPIERVHEKIKQHQCTTCQKSFIRKSTLKMHTEMVHEKRTMWSEWLLSFTTHRPNKTQWLCPWKTETTLIYKPGGLDLSRHRKKQSRQSRKSWQFQKISLHDRDISILSQHIPKVRKVSIETKKSVETWHFWQISTVCLNLNWKLVNAVTFLDRVFSICQDFWAWSLKKVWKKSRLCQEISKILHLSGRSR